MDKKNKNQSALTIETIQALFNTYDDDGNKSLDKDEFRNLLDDLRAHIGLPKSDDLLFQTVFGIIDRNGNGMIELDELIDKLDKIYPLLSDITEGMKKMIKRDFLDFDTDKSGF